MRRVNKWIIFTVIGCLAYFAGYIWGHQVQKAAISIENINSVPQK
jgi:hypothetical protein